MVFSDVALFEQKFVNRTDCYCKQLPTGGYTRIDQPITLQILKQHLDRKITIGSYQLDKTNKVKWLCFDIDPEKFSDPQAIVKQLLSVMRRKIKDKTEEEKPLIWDNALILEASRYPDPSYHIWILFLIPLKANVARWIALHILKKANLNPKLVEVFPKQNEITPERPYGNFVKLPFSKHQVEQKYSQMLDLETLKPIPTECFKEKTGISLTEKDLKTIENQKIQNSIQMALTSQPTIKKISTSELKQVTDFLIRYWIKGFRNKLTISICGYCIKKGIDHQTARQTIQTICNKTNTSPIETEEFLQNVDYQYLNRKNINLKGISGIFEVIQDIKKMQGANA